MPQSPPPIEMRNKGSFRSHPKKIRKKNEEEKKEKGGKGK